MIFSHRPFLLMRWYWCRFFTTGKQPTRCWLGRKSTRWRWRSRTISITLQSSKWTTRTYARLDRKFQHPDVSIDAKLLLSTLIKKATKRWKSFPDDLLLPNKRHPLYSGSESWAPALLPHSQQQTLLRFASTLIRQCAIQWCDLIEWTNLAHRTDNAAAQKEAHRYRTGHLDLHSRHNL